MRNSELHRTIAPSHRRKEELGIRNLIATTYLRIRLGTHNG